MIMLEKSKYQSECSYALDVFVYVEHFRSLVLAQRGSNDADLVNLTQPNKICVQSV